MPGTTGAGFEPCAAGRPAAAARTICGGDSIGSDVGCVHSCAESLHGADAVLFFALAKLARTRGRSRASM